MTFPSPLRHPAAFAVALIGLLPGSSAVAQALRLPTTDAHHEFFYVTAYYDHGGVQDWSCGSNSYDGHRGTDFGVGSWAGMDAGRDVVAAAEGMVEATNDGEFDRCDTGACDGGGGYGNYVMVRHPDGKLTIYAHLKSGSVAVATGDAVTCGQHLGEVGSSGHSTGPHLHFEVRDADDNRVDPFSGDCSAGESLWVDQGAYDELPATLCAGPAPTCEPSADLICGQSVSRDNTGAGSTQQTSLYGCGEFSYSGSEVSFRVSSTLSETMTLRLTGLQADLDLFLLSDATCHGAGCLAGSTSSNTTDEVITQAVEAGVTYVVVVDGWEGATSPFTLAVECQGVPTLPDAGVPDAGPVDAAVVDDASVTADASPGTDASGGGAGVGSGCGCAASGTAGGTPILLLLAAWILRRRRS